MRSGEVDCAVGLLANDGVGNSWGRGRVGNHQRSDATAGEDFCRHGAESLAKESRIASDDNARALRFLRTDISGDTGDRAADIFEGKFLGHHCAPSGCAKLDLCGHD